MVAPTRLLLGTLGLKAELPAATQALNPLKKPQTQIGTWQQHMGFTECLEALALGGTEEKLPGFPQCLRWAHAQHQKCVKMVMGELVPPSSLQPQRQRENNVLQMM